MSPLRSLIISAAAIPDATADAVNNLINGIQSNLNHGNQEIQSVQTLQSLESNIASASAIATSISNVKAALNLAIADRTSNQALTADFPTVLAGLAKVQAAQVKATATVATLSGVAANNAPILSGLLTTFEGGIATNQNNLALVIFL